MARRHFGDCLPCENAMLKTFTRFNNRTKLPFQTITSWNKEWDVLIFGSVAGGQEIISKSPISSPLLPPPPSPQKALHFISLYFTLGFSLYSSATAASSSPKRFTLYFTFQKSFSLYSYYRATKKTLHFTHSSATTASFPPKTLHLRL